MKAALKITQWVIALFIVLIFVGLRWGLTPMPKPPAGVRLEPLTPPLKADQVTSNNAAFYYLEAARLIENYGQSPESENQMHSILAGDLSGDSMALRQTLTDCAPALELMREGTTIEYCQLPEPEGWIEGLDYHTPIRQLARLESCAGRLARFDGDIAGAVEHHLTVVKLGSDYMHGGGYISQLVGYAIESIGLVSLRADVIEDSPSIEVVKSAIDRLRQSQSNGQLPEESLRYELVHSYQSSNSLLTNTGAAILFSEGVMRGLHKAAYGDFIQETAKPYWEADTTSLMEKWSPTNRPAWKVMLDRPIASSTVSFLMRVYDSIPQKAARNTAEFEATMLTCAIRGFVLAQGQPPDKLAELVPSFLPTVAIDPFDGKPMRYRRNGNDWVVWSVGSDKKDDNAERHEFKYRKRKDSKGGDIYWKSTEPADDLDCELSRTGVTQSPLPK